MEDALNLHVLYYDTDFPIAEDNLFISTKTYKNAKDWDKNSGMDGCRPIMFLDKTRFTSDEPEILKNFLTVLDKN